LAALRFGIARIAPEFQAEPVAWLGERMNSLAVSIGDAFVFCFSKHAEAAMGLRREIVQRLGSVEPAVKRKLEVIREACLQGES
jgi:hypothetical protein